MKWINAQEYLPPHAGEYLIDMYGYYKDRAVTLMRESIELAWYSDGEFWLRPGIKAAVAFWSQIERPPKTRLRALWIGDKAGDNEALAALRTELYYARLFLKLSEEYVCKILNLSVEDLRAIEKGDKEISKRQAQLFSKLYGIKAKEGKQQKIIADEGIFA